jgi:glycosyltransferase involved in cell wall biosynthesis
MRIAIFSDTFPPEINGVANFVRLSARALARRGHLVQVFTVSKISEKKLNEKIGMNNLKIVTVPSVSSLIYPNTRFSLPSGLAVVRLKKFNPDVIHVHTPFALGWEGVMGAKILKKPLIGTHHTFFDQYLKHAKIDFETARKATWKYTVGFYNFCNLVTTPSQSLAKEMEGHGLKAPLTVLPNFVDTIFFKPISKTEKNNSKKQFGIVGQSLVYMGRLSYEKSIDQVIKAFKLSLKKFPNLKLMIIGDGPEKENLEELANKLKIADKVIFTGFLRGKKLVAALQANNFFITASVTETFGIAIAEAMAAGLPVIAVRRGGIGEIVKDRKNGYLTSTNSPFEIGEKIRKMAVNSASVRKNFINTSRKLARKYSLEKIISRFEKTYKTLVPRKIKICFYFEFHKLLNQTLKRKWENGIISCYENQYKVLENLNVKLTKAFSKDCDILEINFPGPKSLWLMKKAKFFGKKIVLWSHTTAEDFKKSVIFSDSIYPLQKKYLSYVYNLADLVFCPSHYTKKLLLSYRIPEKKIVIRSSGIDLRIFKKDRQKRKFFRQKHNLKDITIGCLGIVIPRKGTKTFGALAKKFPNNRFLWIGKVFPKSLVRALPSKLPGNINFTGNVDHYQGVPFALNGLDIFCFPSYEENHPNAVLEAMATELPILIRDIPAYDHWLTHGKNCLKAKNDKEFEKYLKILIKDKNLRKKLGQNAREMAKKEDVTVQSKNLLKIYKKIIAKN